MQKKPQVKPQPLLNSSKNKSTLVSELNTGEVYKYFNVWVGTGGFATSKNIENPVVCFKVEKSWMQDKKIDPASITLNRYSEKKWEQLTVEPSGNDDKFLYFTAKTPGFSSFAITGKEKIVSAQKETKIKPELENGIINTSYANQNDTGNKGMKAEQKEIPRTPGFEIGLGIACVLGLFLNKRK